MLPPVFELRPWLQALRHFAGDRPVYYFPHFEQSFDPVRPEPSHQIERLRAQFSLAESRHQNFFLVTNRFALKQSVLRPQFLESLRLKLKKSDWLERPTFLQYLRGAGFVEDTTVQDQGFFSVRGHLIDVFDPISDTPYRLEFFGDEIVSIRSFDPLTQRSLKEWDEIYLHPCREFAFSVSTQDEIFRELKLLGDLRGISRDEREETVWKIQRQRDFINTRLFLPAMKQGLVSLVEYLDPQTEFVEIDPEESQAQCEELLKEEERSAKDSKAFHYPIELLQNTQEACSTAYAVYSRIKAGTEIHDVLQHESLRSQLIRSKSFRPLIEEVGRLKDNQTEVHLVVNHPKRKEALQEALDELNEIVSWQNGPPFLGFQSQSLGVAVFTERDLFGQSRKSAKGRSEIKASDFLREFSDLKAGDFVVHEEHGLGRYQGLVTLEVSQAKSEFAQIEYFDGDKLYLPIYRLHQISRFVRGDGYAEPKLDRLGSQSFLRKKNRAKEDILRIAHQLIEIAAHRKLISFTRPPIDESLYEEFCQSFPYELTADQDSAIRAIEKDLTQPHPMDRLVCGDVGFGKTEVALRAIMFRLLQKTQVAVLAPTTLLVEQHYQDFKKRFGRFGIRVERLSRFASSAEQKQSIQALQSGDLAIVIGTHRLLQRDIQFANLGLLVVDEEQRFGVKHKERIKKLKRDLDVLSLSATPIPRTLQMSIAGIRDLSLIVTPPESREEVATSVGFYDDSLIRTAALKEFTRGGQIFFVHNRVKSIEGLTDRLRKLLPELKIEFAHGQMPEDELESKMMRFINRDFDMLVATSIIENGIDIPNVNTLFVDHAEMFGLSDLYQIRGRVGRSDRKAYAYFLVHEETPLTEEASKRLHVIQSCTALGSGFRVATHDLEIRGSGNLLGEEQSGVIAEIGLELYNQMLEESLNEIREGRSGSASLPEMNFSYTAYIPDHYIPDPSLRVSSYRRLNQIENLPELTEFESELLDRFGLYPRELENLCHLTQLRCMAHNLKAESLDCSPGRLIMSFHPDTPLDPQKLLSRFKEGLRFDSKGRLVYSFASALDGPAKTGKEEAEDFKTLHRFMKDLSQTIDLCQKT